jgi:hypothetical protein
MYPFVPSIGHCLNSVKTIKGIKRTSNFFYIDLRFGN